MNEKLPAAPSGSIYNNITTFESGQRMAKALSESSLVPQDYRNNIANTMIALEMAQRTGSSPMAVMQNMHVIHGRPSWSSQFVIAALNSCGRFSPLRFRVTGTGDDETCVAFAIDKSTGEELEGPAVSIRMAKEEGWYGKNGSKWKTMPQLMLRYRSAKFFGNLYAPDILMGMSTEEEAEDIAPQRPSQGRTFTSSEPVTGEVIDAEPVPEPEPAPGPRQRKKPEPQPDIPPAPPADDGLEDVF